VGAVVSRAPSISATRPKFLKICLVGPPSIGKHSLVTRFVSGKLSKRQDQLSTDTKSIAVFGLEVMMLMWTVRSRNTSMMFLMCDYLRNVDLFVVVYDSSRRTFLIDLEEWIYEVERLCSGNRQAGPCLFYLVDNKRKELVGGPTIENERLKEVMARPDVLGQMEVSVLDNVNILQLFQALAVAILCREATVLAQTSYPPLCIPNPAESLINWDFFASRLSQ